MIRALLDDSGTPFLMRGVNSPYSWFQLCPPQQDPAAIATIGSNWNYTSGGTSAH